jgi:hypothetical protein
LKRTRMILFLLVFSFLLAACGLDTSIAGVTQAAQVGGSAQQPVSHSTNSIASPTPIVVDSQSPKWTEIPQTAVTVPVTVSSSTTLNWTVQLPVLTSANQDVTFGAGQIVNVLGEGYQPGETTVVSLIHDTQGVLANKTVQADALGYVLVVKRLSMGVEDQDALPAGHLIYQISGAGQTHQYGFFVDYALQEFPTSKGCGSYPEKAAFNGYQVFFCGGLNPKQAYQLTSRLDEATDQVVNTADAFGLVLFPMRQSSKTLAPGTWTVSLGQFTNINTPPKDIGYTSMTVEIVSDK